jgi:hypothetical protein
MKDEHRKYCMTQTNDTHDPYPVRHHPRFDGQMAPLKISYYIGSPAAPPEVRQHLSPTPADRNEWCVLLTWEEATAVLCRAHVADFEFHPNDFDWQARGWSRDFRVHEPIDATDLQQKWHQLPPNPTTADYAAAVLEQYWNDIEQMSYKSCLARAISAGIPQEQAERASKKASKVYDVLYKELVAWFRPAMISVPGFRDGKVQRVDRRKLLRRAFELMTVGTSDIDPFVPQFIELGGGQVEIDIYTDKVAFDRACAEAGGADPS